MAAKRKVRNVSTYFAFWILKEFASMWSKSWLHSRKSALPSFLSFFDTPLIWS